MRISRTRLEDLADELVALSEENSARADRLIEQLRRTRKDRVKGKQASRSVPEPGVDAADVDRLRPN